MNRFLVLTCLGLLLPALCQAQFSRLPLPIPFLPVRGATTVPGNGAGIGFELGTALLGPELSRGEVFGAAVSFGWKDLFTLSVGNPRTGDVSGRAKADLQLLRIKTALLKPRGLRPAVALAVARSWGDLRVSRRANGTLAITDTLQDDHVASWEFAIPAELLLFKHGKQARTSVFFGPRFTLSRYDDRLETDGPFGAVLPGAVAGVHVSALFFEVFLEGNLIHVPSHSYGGGAFGGHVSFMPAIGGVFRIGPAFKWANPQP